MSNQESKFFGDCGLKERLPEAEKTRQEVLRNEFSVAKGSSVYC